MFISVIYECELDDVSVRTDYREHFSSTESPPTDEDIKFEAFLHICGDDMEWESFDDNDSYPVSASQLRNQSLVDFNRMVFKVLHREVVDDGIDVNDDDD